ncbi:hypothetical protein B0H10DRAFT_1942308 [Mycena sp. CBHHK59/15]|nr:hypothetical protein B0H10DRAFT_1942308 [Mycena sp. CBHHK59/15]
MASFTFFLLFSLLPLVFLSFFCLSPMSLQPRYSCLQCPLSPTILHLIPVTSSETCVVCMRPWFCYEAAPFQDTAHINFHYQRSSCPTTQCGGFYSDQLWWSFFTTCICLAQWMSHDPIVDPVPTSISTATSSVPATIPAPAPLALSAPASPITVFQAVFATAVIPGSVGTRRISSALWTLPQHQIPGPYEPAGYGTRKLWTQNEHMLNYCNHFQQHGFLFTLKVPASGIMSPTDFTSAIHLGMETLVDPLTAWSSTRRFFVTMAVTSSTLVHTQGLLLLLLWLPRRLFGRGHLQHLSLDELMPLVITTPPVATPIPEALTSLPIALELVTFRPLLHVIPQYLVLRHEDKLRHPKELDPVPFTLRRFWCHGGLLIFGDEAEDVWKTDISPVMTTSLTAQLEPEHFGDDGIKACHAQLQLDRANEILYAHSLKDAQQHTIRWVRCSELFHKFDWNLQNQQPPWEKDLDDVARCHWLSCLLEVVKEWPCTAQMTWFLAENGFDKLIVSLGERQTKAFCKQLSNGKLRMLEVSMVAVYYQGVFDALGILGVGATRKPYFTPAMEPFFSM